MQTCGQVYCFERLQRSLWNWKKVDSLSGQLVRWTAMPEPVFMPVPVSISCLDRNGVRLTVVVPQKIHQLHPWQLWGWHMPVFYTSVLVCVCVCGLQVRSTYGAGPELVLQLNSYNINVDVQVVISLLVKCLTSHECKFLLVLQFHR